MPSFVFRAVVGVVNGAACAVNHLLEVMYPKDIGHIWEDVPAGSVASGGPAPTDPPSGGVADPAAEKVPPDLSAAGSPLATPTAQTLTEIYLGISEADLWAAAHYVDNWAALSECSDNPHYQVRLQDLATRLRDASRNLRVSQ